MPRTLVRHCWTYGPPERMVQAEDARKLDAEVTVKRGPEPMPEDVARNAGARLGRSGGDARSDTAV